MQNVIMNKVQELHEQIATAKHNLGKPQPLAANFTKKTALDQFFVELNQFFRRSRNIWCAFSRVNNS